MQVIYDIPKELEQVPLVSVQLPSGTWVLTALWPDRAQTLAGCILSAAAVNDPIVQDLGQQLLHRLYFLEDKQWP